MKKIISMYGRAMLDAMVIIGLMLLLFTQVQDNAGNRGMFRILGARLTASTQNINYDGYTDFDITVADSQKQKPVITYTGSNRIHIGHTVLTDYISATDYSGTALPVKILKVVDPAGADVYCDPNTEIECMMSGVYVVTVSAVDDICKKTVCTIRIPVN